MNAARMSMRRQWENIGRNGAKAGVPLDKILTANISINVLIRAGYEKGKRDAAAKGEKA